MLEDEYARENSLLRKCVLSAFSSNSGLLVSSERNLSIGAIRAIDPRSPRMETIGDAQSAVDVLRED